METVTVADLIDFLNGARPDASVFLDAEEWREAGEAGHVLAYVLDDIREAKASHIDAL
jgi:hypothetical protein